MSIRCTGSPEARRHTLPHPVGVPGPRPGSRRGLLPRRPKRPHEGMHRQERPGVLECGDGGRNEHGGGDGNECAAVVRRPRRAERGSECDHSADGKSDRAHGKTVAGGIDESERVEDADAQADDPVGA